VEAIKDALEKEFALDQHTSLWIQKIDKDPKAYGVNDLHSKLAKIGLIPSRIGNGIQSKFPLKNTCKNILKMGLRMGSMPKRLINGNTLLKHCLGLFHPARISGT